MNKTAHKMAIRFNKIIVFISELIDLKDVFVFGGLACAVYGISMIYPAAAWITFGISIAILGLRR